MKKIFYLFAALCLSAGLNSCERQLKCDTVPDGGIQPINFSTSSFDYSIVTRSDLSTMCSQGFGVLGYNTREQNFKDVLEPEKVIDNYKLLSSDGKNWRYEDAVAFWNTSSSDKYSFFAYHPYDEDMQTTSLAVPVGTYINDCVDYLVASPVMDQVTKSGVVLDFEHIFSRINVNLRLSKAFEKQTYTLKNIRFSGVREYPSYSLVDGFDMSSSEFHTISSTEENISNPSLNAVTDLITVDPIYVSPYDYETKNDFFEVIFTFDYTFLNSAGVSVTNEFSRGIEISKDLQKNKEYNLNVVFTPDEEGGISFTVSLDDYSEKEGLDFGVEQTAVTDLSKAGIANSYIVTGPGYYKIKAANIGGSIDTQDIANVEVLWETYGTDELINVGDLVYNVVLSGEYIIFNASGKKGNALIAAKDAQGKVLWSWHIWLTDQPEEQTYNNGAGIVMDRNLGATSAAKSDGARTFGLFYQWGRKDPFIGAGTLAGDALAANTGDWPEAVITTLTTDIFDYVNAHPMDFIVKNPSAEINYGWLPDLRQTRWNSSKGLKTVNDPCPYGYRVPNGGETGLWATASESPTTLLNLTSFDAVNLGHDLADMMASGVSSCWYPSNGRLNAENGSLESVGERGACWGNGMYISVANKIYDGQSLAIAETSFMPDMRHSTASGVAVRCERE